MRTPPKESLSKFTGNHASTNFRDSIYKDMRIQLQEMAMKPSLGSIIHSTLHIQSLNLEKDLMFLTKYIELAPTAIAAGVVDDVRLLVEAAVYSFLLHSLSSSLMVSNTFDVRRLMTLIICGGATSVTNLAIREFAIFFGELDVGG